MSRTAMRVLGALARPVQFAVYLLAGLVPRDPRRWAFGTWSGTRFADNAAAVFVHLHEHPEPGVRAVWITRRSEIRDRLRARGMRCHLAWSPGGIWAGLRSGVYVYDSIPQDLNFWLSRGARLVLLRHGIGMKKIERAIDAPDHRLYKLFHGSLAQRALWRTALPWHVPVPHLVMACSPAHAAQAPAYFGVDLERVRITGFPRHDRLADPVARAPERIPTVGAPIPSDRPAFLYLPTFREGFVRQRFPWADLQRAAVAAGVTIAVKLHVVDAERGVQGTGELERASHLRQVDPDVDPIEIYPHAAGLITDFSSVAYDLLLLERPVVHFVPDLEAFQAQRPLTGSFDDMAVGPICRTGDELVEALRRVAHEGDAASDDRRLQLRRRFYTHAPGGASERVVDAIRELVDGPPSPAPPAPGRPAS